MFTRIRTGNRLRGVSTETAARPRPLRLTQARIGDTLHDGSSAGVVIIVGKPRLVQSVNAPATPARVLPHASPARAARDSRSRVRAVPGGRQSPWTAHRRFRRVPRSASR